MVLLGIFDVFSFKNFCTYSILYVHFGEMQHFFKVFNIDF